MTNHRLIIDTDAGIDDAEAILMALGHPNAHIEAITTVTGNIDVEQVTRNVCTILHITQRTDIPVYKGAQHPLVENWEDAGYYHLADGLGDWDERPAIEPFAQAEHAANALVRLVNQHPHELTLVALGPLTNVALALQLDPTIAQKLKKFVFMGGAVNAVGNISRVTAEFNIGTDPEAAFMVLRAIPHAVMVGWEVTLEHPLSWADFDRLCALQTPEAAFFRGMTHKVSQRWRTVKGNDGHLLPDPLAMAVTLEPSLVLEQSRRFVTVELGGTHTRGQTVVNYTKHDLGTPHVDIIQRVDMGGVVALYTQMLGGNR